MISIHAPLAGCDRPFPGGRRWSVPISIHAPLAGCDGLYAPDDHACLRYFNPRTPCGVRPPIASPMAKPTRISIHAPLAGCDFTFYSITFYRRNFNPRTPCGVRLSEAKDAQSKFGFQSTHPLRGATNEIDENNKCMDISNNAPLGGCDAASGFSMPFQALFQSTHPLRGATSRRMPPRTANSNFNPRTPCGVRRR